MMMEKEQIKNDKNGKTVEKNNNEKTYKGFVNCGEVIFIIMSLQKKRT